METNNDLTALISISRNILSELELLTSSIKASALVRFQNDFLLTDLQRKIYAEIDGEKDSQAIADATGASLRAVQLLIKDLTEKDLINVQKRGRSIIPGKEISKIATYYAKHDILNGGGQLEWVVKIISKKCLLNF